MSIDPVIVTVSAVYVVMSLANLLISDATDPDPQHTPLWHTLLWRGLMWPKGVVTNITWLIKNWSKQ
jgi:hypothetical protein